MQLGLQINLHDDFDPKTQNHFSLRHTATQPDGEELQDEKTARVSSSIFRSQQLVNLETVVLFLCRSACDHGQACDVPMDVESDGSWSCWLNSALHSLRCTLLRAKSTLLFCVRARNFLNHEATSFASQ